MITRKFTVLKLGSPDAQGDVFRPGSVKMAKDKIPVLLDFENHKIAGEVLSIEERGDELIVTANLLENFTGLIPAIGFKAIHKNKMADGLTEYTDIELYSIGLCGNPNIDHSIPPL